MQLMIEDKKARNNTIHDLMSIRSMASLPQRKTTLVETKGLVMKCVVTVLAVAFALMNTASTGWCWPQWNPRKSIEEGISGKKSFNQQFNDQVDKAVEPVRPRYETNKFELKAQQEEGGWVLAWSDDLSETDAIEGVVAAGVSIYTGGSSFVLWVHELVDRTIQSTMDSARTRFPDYIQRQAENLAQQVIFAAIQGKSPRQALRNFDTVDFKAGAIRYTGGNYIGNQLAGPHTWGMKIYLGFRVR